MRKVLNNQGGFLYSWPDGTSVKISASGTGGMGSKSRANQISHTLPTTRHRCNLDVWALVQSRGDGHRSLVTPENSAVGAVDAGDATASPSKFFWEQS